MIPKKMVEGVKGTRKHTIRCQWCQEVDEGMPRVLKMHMGGCYGNQEAHQRC
jgi:hypothetical protein